MSDQAMANEDVTLWREEGDEHRAPAEVRLTPYGEIFIGYAGHFVGAKPEEWVKRAELAKVALEAPPDFDRTYLRMDLVRAMLAAGLPPELIPAQAPKIEEYVTGKAGE